MNWAGNFRGTGSPEPAVVELLERSSGHSRVVSDDTGLDEFCCDELHRSFYVHFAVGSEAGDEDRCASTVGLCGVRRWIMVGRAFRLSQQTRVGLLWEDFNI